MRMTSQRKKILDVLHQHDLPMTCDDIHMMIHDRLKYGYIINRADCKDSIEIIHFDYMESLHD